MNARLTRTASRLISSASRAFEVSQSAAPVQRHQLATEVGGAASDCLKGAQSSNDALEQGCSAELDHVPINELAAVNAPFVETTPPPRSSATLSDVAEVRTTVVSPPKRLRGASVEVASAIATSDRRACVERR